jgi:hypothetical protein
MEIKKKLKPAIFAGFCGNPELVLQKRPGPVAASLKQPFCLRFFAGGENGENSAAEGTLLPRLYIKVSARVFDVS